MLWSLDEKDVLSGGEGVTAAAERGQTDQLAASVDKGARGLARNTQTLVFAGGR